MQHSGVVVNEKKIIHLWNIQILLAAIDVGAIINNLSHIHRTARRSRNSITTPTSER